ncbi:Tn7-like element transposition protein TnsE [Metasolibacillus meyeri]|uniref:Tn7-like element transposition protein TnsE n=1 Tax=Metasolibacillus meyeri TaxID=1071052 RepID=A0AAW9NWU1_9BACL|nr:Tn7-like element transposition protein TnsE [Metasolibacillus meyeri]MEC1180494.1 Tn7-like element transposition protein TnsE [Metasolibacillus meyeri]
MSEQQVKLKNWPFRNGEKAQLIWISSPFQYEKKIMIHAYFKAKGKTEKLLVDWGTLPALAIQHYYMDGDIRKSIPPNETEEAEITMYPNMVSLHEKEWEIYGTDDKDVSRSFIVKQGNRTYILPLIEVVRSILAPNRFLLYRLFEANSFPQYFIESYEHNKINLNFSSQYHRKYTQSNFLYQLVWLLTNQDLRNVFENVAYIFNNTGILKFDWSFKQPITIKAVVKPNANGGTVLRVSNVKNKHIPYSEVFFSHPEIVRSEKSKEAKKYTLHTKKKNLNGQQEELMLDEEIEGTTDNFDIIEMDNQKHEYIAMPKITKLSRGTNKKRDFEDENTKRRFINDEGRRSSADTGGNQLTRGLEQLSLMDIQIDGELGEFIKVMRVLQDFPEVQSINIIQGSLKEFSDTKRFVYLSDGVTERKYVIAEVYLLNGRDFKIIEVEREFFSLSILILSSSGIYKWESLYRKILLNIVKDNGTWSKISIEGIKNQGVELIKMKHSKKNIHYRVEKLLNKLNNL